MAKSKKENAEAKFITVMREFGKGKLHHGSTDKLVKRVDVARAIAYSEARKIDPNFGSKHATVYTIEEEDGTESRISIPSNNKSNKKIMLVHFGRPGKNGVRPIITISHDTLDEKQISELRKILEAIEAKKSNL